jgi:anti-anti-sigma factor
MISVGWGPTTEEGSGAMRGNPNISFDVRVRDGLTFARVSGDLDILTGVAFEAFLHDLRDTHAHVRLDISRLEFMDASGLRALGRATSGGRDWLEILPQVQPQVWRMLTLTESEQVLSPA